MEKLNSIIQRYVAQDDEDTKGKVLGAAFLLVNKHEIFYSGSAGRIDFGKDARNFDSQSFTWIASMTKLITSVCLLQLVEQKMLGLDDDIKGLVPELATMQILRGFDEDGAPQLEDNTKPITVRQLLTHTTGLTYDAIDPDLVKWSNFIGRPITFFQWSRDEFTAPHKFAPGEGWVYGTGIDWAGMLLEVLTGQSLGEYMKQHVFEPLRMRDTGFWPEQLPQVKSRSVVTSYRGEDGSLKPGPNVTSEMHEIESGGSGLFTTAKDYAIFLQALLQDRKLLREETFKEMFSPQLNDIQRKALDDAGRESEIFTPEFPLGAKIDHGLGGALNPEDLPGRRKKNSLLWAGMANGHWWCDRETGIAGVLTLNVQPYNDEIVRKLWVELEEATYEAMNIS